MKLLTTLIAALAAVWVLAGSATSASAHYRHGGYSGGCCGPIGPTRIYKTIHPHTYSTRYRNKDVYNHVTRIHRVIYVTRVQPIHHINTVTTIHHHRIVHTRNVYEHVVQHLPPIVVRYGSVRNTYDCTCAGSYHHY